MQQMQTIHPRAPEGQPERKTLRDFNFLECTHPDGTIAYETKEDAHCGFCGAKRKGNEWVGGSVDYRIDTLVLKVWGAKLAENVK
jgi:hypothetical protein